MKTSNPSFKMQMIFNNETIRRLFKTEFYVYEGTKRIAWSGIGVALIATAVFVAVSDVIKIMCLMFGCMMLAIPDFLSLLIAEGVIARRGGAVSTVTIRVDSIGIHQENGTTVSFSQIDRLIADEQYFYLFQNRQAAVMIPKNQVKKESEFMEFISDKTGKTWKGTKKLWELTGRDVLQMFRDRFRR